MDALQKNLQSRDSVPTQGECKFRCSTRDRVFVNSFSSSNGCNPLHFLPLFEEWGISEDQDIITMVDTTTLTRPLPYSRSQKRKRSLRAIVSRFGPTFISGTTNTTYYLDPHFPLTLEGTPLSFAVILGCHEAIEALMFEGADPIGVPPPSFTDSLQGETVSCIEERRGINSSPLYSAISCHQPETFSLLWAACGEHGSQQELWELLCKHSSDGANIVSALARRSPLERVLIHGANKDKAQTAMIKTIITKFSYLSAQVSPQPFDTHMVTFVSKGVQGILELGDLNLATEVMAILRGQGPCSYYALHPLWASELQHDLMEVAHRVACSGSTNLDESRKYLQLAKDLIPETYVDMRAVRTMMGWRSEELFCHCLENGLQLRGADENGETPLHYAITTGFCRQFPLAELVSRGVDINCADSKGTTPLHLATTLGLHAMVKELLEMGADPTATDDNGLSVLRCAVESEKQSIVSEILVAFGSSGSSDRRIVLSAARFRKAIMYGNEVGNAPTDGMTLLHLGVRKRNLDFVKVILGIGADVNATDIESNSALHCAVLMNDIADVVTHSRTLLDADANPLLLNKGGDSAFHLGFRRWKVDAPDKYLNCLTKHGKSVIDTKDARGSTVLHEAVSMSSVALFSSLRRFGASIYLKNSQGQSLLHICGQVIITRNGKPVHGSSTRVRNSSQIAEELLRLGVDPFMKDVHGLTAMDYAATVGNGLLLSTLIAEIDHQYCRTDQPQCSTNQTSVADQASIEPLSTVISSGWSFVVREEQWSIVKNLLESRPSPELDMSLLKWPAGARLFWFAIQLEAEDLIRAFRKRHFVRTLSTNSIGITSVDPLLFMSYVDFLQAAPGVGFGEVYDDIHWWSPKRMRAIEIQISHDEVHHGVTYCMKYICIFEDGTEPS